MAAGDVVPVPGDSFEQTLASASPDLLRAMVREFAQRMMDTDDEIRVTRYRLRAVQDRWIPGLEQTLAAVTFAIEELERADAARLRLASAPARPSG